MIKSIERADLERLAQIVREETGNQVAEKNYSMVEARMRVRVSQLGFAQMADYWAYFASHEKEERDVLQGLMTTHYTFFFREFVHFEILEKWLLSADESLRRRFEETRIPLRVWSAACSRGQEVYSLAMFLSVKCPIPFEIVGTDIDAESVRFAANGVYPIKEVNTIPHVYLDKNWKRGTGSIKDFAAVHPDLKKRTRFEALNLLEVESWSESSAFDVIFCRNVFIYFAEEMVKKIALSLRDRLVDGGLLVSGVSEPLRFQEWTLAPVGPSAYQKGELTATPITPTPSLRVEPVSAVKVKVLCVDDSKTIQVLMKKIFAMDPSFAAVDVAVNGREAREKLDRTSYDLITLDIHMPEVNGIEFLERLYKRRNDPPVLMISSVNRTDVDLATKALALGAFDYVEKPAMNNLAKSSGEILTKAKMAVRSRSQEAQGAGSFDQSISQKIVVPDASQCLRIVLANSGSWSSLADVVKSQGAEYRSPALLVVWGDAESFADLESRVLQWTPKTVRTLKSAESFLKANHVYVVSLDNLALLENVRTKSISFQVLAPVPFASGLLRVATKVQALVDEPLNTKIKEIERQYGLPISDVTPATSFTSLSLEFFANLRKAAA